MRRTAVAVLLVVSCTFHSDTHLLSLTFSKDQQSRYSFHLLSSQTVDTHGVSQTSSVDIRAIATQTVVSVGPGGIADVTLTLSNVHMKTTAEGQTSEADLDASFPFQEVSLAPDARQLTIDRVGIAATSPLGEAGEAGAPVWSVLSSGTVKVGDSWTRDYDQANPLGSGTVHMKTTSTYVRDEIVDGAATAVVDTKSKAWLDFTIDSAKLPSTTYMQPPQTQTGAAGVVQRTITLVTSTQVMGSTTSEVTTWVDVNAHRVVKTQMSGAIKGTLVLVVAPVAALSGTEGPYPITGSRTLTLDPV